MENRQNPIYRDAFKHGGDRVIQDAAKLCRDIGNRIGASYGPKYELRLENLVIYVDDYGGYVTIHADNEIKASNHLCDQYLIGGEWEQVLNRALMTEPSFLAEAI